MKARGTELAEKGFATLDKALDGKEYAVGPFSIADSALFYVEFWAKRVGIASAGELRGASGSDAGSALGATDIESGRPCLKRWKNSR